MKKKKRKNHVNCGNLIRWCRHTQFSFNIQLKWLVIVIKRMKSPFKHPLSCCRIGSDSASISSKITNTIKLHFFAQLKRYNKNEGMKRYPRIKKFFGLSFSLTTNCIQNRETCAWG